MAQRLSNKAKLKSLFTVTGSAFALFGGISLYQGNEKFYNEVAIPIMHLLDPETAHNVAVKILKWGLVSSQKTEDLCLLRTSVLGFNLTNPIGMAAGFDKQGEAIEGLHKIGFSFVEIGELFFFQFFVSSNSAVNFYFVCCRICDA